MASASKQNNFTGVSPCLAAIVAPQFMTTNPITITGLCTAVAVAVWSRNMAATVIVSMLVYAGLRNWI